MRRRASEIINDLEIRISSLEKSAGGFRAKHKTNFAGLSDFSPYGIVQVDGIGGGGLYLITNAPDVARKFIPRLGLVEDRSGSFAGRYGFEFISIETENYTIESQETLLKDNMNFTFIKLEREAAYSDEIDAGRKGITSIMRSRADHYSHIMDQIKKNY